MSRLIIALAALWAFGWIPVRLFGPLARQVWNHTLARYRAIHATTYRAPITLTIEADFEPLKAAFKGLAAAARKCDASARRLHEQLNQEPTDA